jgi:hypothetical protein
MIVLPPTPTEPEPVAYIDPGHDLGAFETGGGTIAELLDSFKPDMSPDLSFSEVSETLVESTASSRGSGSSDSTGSVSKIFASTPLDGDEDEGEYLGPRPSPFLVYDTAQSLDIITPSDAIDLEASYLAAALEWLRKTEQSRVLACAEDGECERLSPDEAKRLEAGYFEAAVALFTKERAGFVEELDDEFDKCERIGSDGGEGFG